MASRGGPGGIAGWPRRGLRTRRHDSTHEHQSREHFRTSWLECRYPKHYQLVSVVLALRIMSIACLLVEIEHTSAAAFVGSLSAKMPFHRAILLMGMDLQSSGVF